MALPEFNENGELPPGVHPVSLEEACRRFAGDSPKRQQAVANLRRLHQLAAGTGKLLRFVVFGSFVTSNPAPNDVDVILLMCDDFHMEECDPETRILFDHQQAPAHFGASIFWTRPKGIFAESVEDFIASWQVKRGGGRRGIIEVIP
jgi:hypothetical protein